MEERTQYLPPTPVAPKKRSTGKIILWVIGGLMVIGAISEISDPTEVTTEPTAAPQVVTTDTVASGYTLTDVDRTIADALWAQRSSSTQANICMLIDADHEAAVTAMETGLRQSGSNAYGGADLHDVAVAITDYLDGTKC